MGWVRAVWRLLQDEFFPSTAQTLISLFAFAVALLTALGIFFKITELAANVAPGEPAFLSYIWTTFLVSCLFLATTSVLMQRLLRRHSDILELKSRIDRAVVIQHHTAETVRRAAAERTTLDLKSCLDRVLGHELREYLKHRLGNYEIHCTVKKIARSPSGDGFQLIDVFRDDDQNEHSRPRSTPEWASENFIYSQFKNASVDDAKQIYIRDVNSGGVWETLSARAHSRGYKSVLAFPLNQPAPSGPPILDRTVGFLGLDSPEAHAFDGLFAFHRGDDSAGHPDGVYKPLDELNFLYGIADSVATVLMLVQDSRPDGSAD